MNELFSNYILRTIAILQLLVTCYMEVCCELVIQLRSVCIPDSLSLTNLGTFLRTKATAPGNSIFIFCLNLVACLRGLAVKHPQCTLCLTGSWLDPRFNSRWWPDYFGPDY